MSSYDERARWGVFEEYFGLFDSSQFVCFCDSISNAAHIIDALLIRNQDRPFNYKAVKLSDDYIDYLDDIIQCDIFGEPESDFSKYLQGLSCFVFR